MGVCISKLLQLLTIVNANRNHNFNLLITTQLLILDHSAAVCCLLEKRVWICFVFAMIIVTSLQSLFDLLFLSSPYIIIFLKTLQLFYLTLGSDSDV